ncbi:MAG: cysteate synthase [Bacteroidetes bacterium]|nr:cysteate synthase [Bacteroidota bacterium]
MSAYLLQNIATGRIFTDEGWTLSDPEYSQSTLIRTIYQKKQLTLKEERYGFYRFADWLPVKRFLAHSTPPVTFRSQELAKRLGLENLYITFNGWWPERGALMETCSFKETEAYSACGRLDGNVGKTLVVASAGNTARAFARICSDNHIPLLLCVPQSNIDTLWFGRPIHKCVRLVCTPPGSDYFDAIRLSNTICSLEGFLEEGGAKNIARRDGMGTTVLSAATHIGVIPDYYVQAVGSGTGAIAAWEANLRLLEDGRFGKSVMKLITVQNHPFVPMYEAWNRGSRSLFPTDSNTACRQLLEIEAKVLSNRQPPYAISGGLFDALTATKGGMCSVTNQEIAQASALFEETEGIDIHPAAAAALAGLRKEMATGKIDKKKIIMLNITGGGEKLYKKGRKLYHLQPELILDADTPLEALPL